jgi:hypothetical protein
MKIFSMMKYLALALFVNAACWGQYSSASNAPDCYFTQTLSTATRTTAFDNRELKCSVWKVQYVNLTNAPASITFDSSSTGTSWAIKSTSGVATITANYFITNFEALYVSVNLISKGTGDVIVAISGYNYKTAKNSPTSNTPDNVPMTTLQDTASATVSYFCKAKSIFDPENNSSYAICTIFRVTYDGSGNFVSKMYADGDAEEDNIWDDRASLTYK